MQLDLCPKKYAVSIFSRDVKSTAESFKSWDTCMDNHTCKIVAIVGIVLAVLVCLWIVASIIRCCCMGVSCLQALCCCCCRSAHKNTYVEPPQQVYNNPNMYPAQPPMRPMEQTYQPINNYKSYSNDYRGDYQGRRYSNEYSGYKPSQF